MSIVIRVVGDWQTNGSLDTRKNDLENQRDTLEGEMDKLERITDDIEDTKEELEDANVFDGSLSEKLNRLNIARSELLYDLADVKNDLETRLRDCQSRLREFSSESESTEEDTVWTTSNCRQQDTMWRL